MDLNGAVALVTGGNGGLGQRVCHALAKEGAHIAVMYAQSRDQAEAVARDLTARHQVNAAAFACDITDGTAVERLVADVTNRFGRLDILVNDAAYNKAIPFPDLDGLTQEVWDRIMAVNLTGPMRLMKAVAPVMKAQGQGRIVNIASVAGLGPTGSSIAYAVSKAGLIHLTRCMAVALAPHQPVGTAMPGCSEPWPKAPSCRLPEGPRGTNGASPPCRGSRPGRGRWRARRGPGVPLPPSPAGVEPSAEKRPGDAHPCRAPSRPSSPPSATFWANA